jgi:hypothetical protein
MIHSRDFSIKIYNGIYIWNQQELLYKMVYKLYDLVKVGQKPPLNGHGLSKFPNFFEILKFRNFYTVFLMIWKRDRDRRVHEDVYGRNGHGHGHVSKS